MVEVTHPLTVDAYPPLPIVPMGDIATPGVDVTVAVPGLITPSNPWKTLPPNVPNVAVPPVPRVPGTGPVLSPPFPPTRAVPTEIV